MIRAAIIGGTGYTGVELMRLIATHPDVTLQYVSSRAEQGKAVKELYPHLRNFQDCIFCNVDDIDFSCIDVVFFATPHGVAQQTIEKIWGYQHLRIIDLSADFRIKDIELWERYYNQKHQAPTLLEQAVYGLPEFNRAAIKQSRLVACPGCYPTSVALGLMPLLERQKIDPSSVIANCSSGISGAGRSAKISNLLAEMSDNYKPYGINNHRHLPEMEMILSQMAQRPVSMVFTPHLLPNIRGILSTIYVQSIEPISTLMLQQYYEQHYRHEPFVTVLPQGELPETRYVRGTNECLISVFNPRPERNHISIFVAEDNLCKGAAGQAIQCMNIQFDLNEATGLRQPALIP